MKRVASMVSSIVALTLVASVALASSANYKDQFFNTGYSGSNGSLDWSESPWQEVKDDGSFETGKVRSVQSGNCPQGDNCLVIYGQSLDLLGVGASRPANLEEFESATLAYKLNFVVNDFLTVAFLHVEGRAGGVWGPLRTPYAINDGSLQGSVSLPGVYLEDDFEFRFVVNGLLAGDVYVDDVEIAGVVSETTTTSTTTSSTTTTLLPTTTTLPKITTTLPTITTTTLPGLLTTTTSSTTTTSHGSTTTTDARTSTTSTTSVGSSDDSSGGSSGDGTTTTTNGSAGPTTSGSTETTSDADTPEAPGLREASLGLQASFDRGRFGNVQTAGFDVMGIDIEPNYTMAVEVIESSWIYLLVLVLLIATAIVSGLDRRRLKRAKHTNV